ALRLQSLPPREHALQARLEQAACAAGESTPLIEEALADGGQQRHAGAGGEAHLVAQAAAGGFLCAELIDDDELGAALERTAYRHPALGERGRVEAAGDRAAAE